MMPAGITYRKDIFGRNRYLRIDLKQHANNQLIEDFIDLLDIEARKGEPTRPFEEVMKEEYERRGLKYDL